MNNFNTYCINLEHRNDRKINSIKNFKKIGINNPIYPFFTKDERGGVYGCFKSHMEIWKQFYKTGDKFCFIFEDDFTFEKNPDTIKKTMIKAIDFVKKNYKNVDILLLHNYCIPVDNKCNDENFINGFGLSTHSMIITRRYIKQIFKKIGYFPTPTGRHIDFEMNHNIIDNDNHIYSDKIYYTKDECFKQIVDKSDNYLNFVDEYIIKDRNLHINYLKKVVSIIKKYTLISDKNIKILAYLYEKYFS